MRDIKYIFFHCTAGPQNQEIKNIQAYWRSLGWKTDGYHFIIKADGTIVNLVPVEKPSNGVAGYNTYAIHICYIGGVEVIKGKNAAGKPVNLIGRPIDNRTEAQKESQLELLLKFHKMFPKAKILGHRDVSPDKNRDGVVSPNEWMKSCPSFSVAEWLKCIGIVSP